MGFDVAFSTNGRAFATAAAILAFVDHGCADAFFSIFDKIFACRSLVFSALTNSAFPAFDDIFPHLIASHACIQSSNVDQSSFEVSLSARPRLNIWSPIHSFPVSIPALTVLSNHVPASQDWTAIGTGVDDMIESTGDTNAFAHLLIVVESDPHAWIFHTISAELSIPVRSHPTTFFGADVIVHAAQPSTHLKFELIHRVSSIPEPIYSHAIFPEEAYLSIAWFVRLDIAFQTHDHWFVRADSATSYASEPACCHASCQFWVNVPFFISAATCPTASFADFIISISPIIKQG